MKLHTGSLSPVNAGSGGAEPLCGILCNYRYSPLMKSLWAVRKRLSDRRTALKAAVQSVRARVATIYADKSGLSARGPV